MNRLTEAIRNHHRQLLRALGERAAAASGGEADPDAVLEFLRDNMYRVRIERIAGGFPLFV